MISSRLLYGAWLTAAARHHRALAKALRSPEAAQQEVLRRILRDNRESRAGRRLGFAAIDSPESFRRNVPLVRYADLAEEVEAIRKGESKVLTREPVRRLVPTGGSTGARKLIPFTRSLGRDFARGVGAWMVDLACRYPEIRSGPAYWSVSPALDPPQGSSAVPIGFDSDAAYLGRWLEPVVE
ncbi:MAG: GH3 auxin-responsive promoter family protein, partial [Acidobacteria bacterium]|nr:GH3 auxin-responsive promoter family protein [Acidobacteriota bacterium]